MKYLGRDKYGFLNAQLDCGNNCILSVEKWKGWARIYEGDTFIGYYVVPNRTAKAVLYKINEYNKGKRWIRIPFKHV